MGGRRMTDGDFLKRIEENSVIKHYIPAEKLLAAYKGIHVSKIKATLVDSMELKGSPHLILDDDMKLCGVFYGVDYEQKGYTLISNPDCGEYLIKRKEDADGNLVIPCGWEDPWAVAEDFANFCRDGGLSD